MGDPLSITASIASLIPLGLQTTEYLCKYYEAYCGQDKDLTPTADELNYLLSSFQIVEMPSEEVEARATWQIQGET